MLWVKIGVAHKVAKKVGFVLAQKVPHFGKHSSLSLISKTYSNLDSYHLFQNFFVSLRAFGRTNVIKP